MNEEKKARIRELNKIVKAWGSAEVSESTFIDLLSQYIGKAFEYEDDFLSQFWRGSDAEELIECYMASERTRIAVLVNSGAHVTDTISTNDFICWCNER